MSGVRGNVDTRSRRLGIAAAVSGLIGLAGFAWLWLVTATPIDPPGWARIIGIWLMPIGIVGALAAGISSVRGSGRPWAIAGLVLAGVTVVAAALLITLWPQ
jgi:hypothetical protein